MAGEVEAPYGSQADFSCPRVPAPTRPMQDWQEHYSEAAFFKQPAGGIQADGRGEEWRRPMGHRLTSCMSRSSSSKQCQCRKSMEFYCGSEIFEQAAESKHADGRREEQSCSVGNRLASCMSQSASPEWGWHRRLVDYCRSKIKEQAAASKGTDSSREEQRCPMGNTLISCMSPSASPKPDRHRKSVEPSCEFQMYKQVAASEGVGVGGEKQRHPLGNALASCMFPNTSHKQSWCRRSVELYLRSENYKQAVVRKHADGRGEGQKCLMSNTLITSVFHNASHEWCWHMRSTGCLRFMRNRRQ